MIYIIPLIIALIMYPFVYKFVTYILEEYKGMYEDIKKEFNK